MLAEKPYGRGILRSSQIFRAKKPFTSRCLGTEEDFRASVYIDGVALPLAMKLAAMLFQMTDEIGTFQAAGRIKVSRMTSAPASESSDKSRFASKTIVTASSRFARASSRVSP